MAKATWNHRDVNQVRAMLEGLTQEDHRRATVDVDGDAWLRALDRLQATVTDARHEAAKALVDLGY